MKVAPLTLAVPSAESAIEAVSSSLSTFMLVAIATESSDTEGIKSKLYEMQQCVGATS